MFVIADIEWLTNAKGHFSPTQLAAVKVDNNWNEAAHFNSLIRPRDGEFHNWEHISYTGGLAFEFLHAKSAHNVLDAFIKWLSEDDIILWWHEESNAVFKKLVKLILKTDFQNKTISIQKYVSTFLYGKELTRINAYKIAEAQNIDINSELKHCSANDVNVIQKLLSAIEYPQENLLNPPKITVPSELTSHLPYQYVSETNTVHLRECPILSESKSETHGFSTLSKPLKRGYIPCECCKEEYKKARMEKNKKIIEQSQYNYIYSPDSAVFHKYNCGTMLSAKRILGTKTYEGVIKTGRKPCRLCNPSPNDRCKPIQLGVKIAHLQAKPKSLANTDDARAILRQKVAYEERCRKLEDKTLTEQERNDVFTLTQPNYAFWVGKGYQTFHLRSCPKLKGLSNLRGFGTYQAAIRAGYTPCRKCRPTSKHDIKASIPIKSRVRPFEKIEDLEVLCNEIGYPYHLEDSYLYLETAVGKWRINTSEAPIRIDHINLVVTPSTNKYHEQPRRFLSFIDAFDYIKRHDDNLEKKAAEGKVFVKLFEE